MLSPLQSMFLIFIGKPSQWLPASHGTLSSHLTDEETDRGEVTCPRSYGSHVAEPEVELHSPCSLLPDPLLDRIVVKKNDLIEVSINVTKIFNNI